MKDREKKAQCCPVPYRSHRCTSDFRQLSWSVGIGMAAFQPSSLEGSVFDSSYRLFCSHPVVPFINRYTSLFQEVLLSFTISRLDSRCLSSVSCSPFLVERTEKPKTGHCNGTKEIRRRRRPGIGLYCD